MHLEAQRYQEFRDLILELVLLFNPRTYCEVGVKKGYVYNTIAPHVERAVAVDKAPFRGIYSGAGTLHYHMNSEDFAREWAKRGDSSIDMLFIDANHTYEAVISDFANLQVFVPECTGLILLHDTFPVQVSLLADGYCSDAWRAAKEIREHWHDFEIVTLPGPRAGLSIIRKAKIHGWMDEQVPTD